MLWGSGVECRLSSHRLKLRVLQVTVDSQGLLKITHMGIAGQGALPTPQRGGASSQRAKSWVEFMILPEDTSIETDE